jgi:hypothetical protein
MMTNVFGNRNFMHPMRRLNMCSSWWAQFFIFWGGVGGDIFLFFFPVPNVFSSCSHRVPQVLKLFSKMFAIAPQFYPIWFAQSSTLMYINWKGRLRVSIFVSILQLESKEVLLLRSAQSSQKIGYGPIVNESYYTTIYLINTNTFAGGEWTCP